jgi:hypothetical protein
MNCRCGYVPYSAADWVAHCALCPSASIVAIYGRGNQLEDQGATPRQRPSQLCVREPDFTRIDRHGWLRVERPPITLYIEKAPATKPPRPARTETTVQANRTTEAI